MSSRTPPPPLVALRARRRSRSPHRPRSPPPASGIAKSNQFVGPDRVAPSMRRAGGWASHLDSILDATPTPKGLASSSLRSSSPRNRIPRVQSGPNGPTQKNGAARREPGNRAATPGRRARALARNAVGPRGRTVGDGGANAWGRHWDRGRDAGPAHRSTAESLDHRIAGGQRTSEVSSYLPTNGTTSITWGEIGLALMGSGQLETGRYRSGGNEPP